MKINLLDFSRQQLKEFLVSNGHQGFRSNQIFKWIYQRYVFDFDLMNDLSKDLRSWLNDNCCISAPEIEIEQISTDGCVKWAMNVGNSKIEAVYIPEENRGTLCVSSQVGCALECTFCSTAQQGFNKNLAVSDIIGQVWRANLRLKELASLASTQPSLKILANKTERPITNVVMMGMGEPLLNVNNLLPALDIMLDDFGYGLSKRRVTISTSGVVPALQNLVGKIDVALAISLHATNDKLRDILVPINKRYNIQSFLDTARAYVNASKANHGKVTVEYVMLDHINDSLDNAQEMTEILHPDECKINLIPWNPFPGAEYKSSSNNRVHAFQRYLSERGYVVTIRKTRGDDIDAACGQLAGQIIDRTKRTKGRESYTSVNKRINITEL